MKTLGILCALDKEADILISRLSFDNIQKIGNINFHFGSINGNNVIICVCGIGKVNAAVSTQILINNFEVDCILNSGIAGALSNDLNILDLVISTELVQHDLILDDHTLEGRVKVIQDNKSVADSELISILKKAANLTLVTTEHNHYDGIIATGDQFIASRDTKDEILNLTNALCVEMEGAAIAKTCELNNIPCVVLRIISDKADDSASMTYEDFAESAAKLSSIIAMQFIELL
ncbi:MAG: 5'-methylthioadenosine/adenosylhomocysteine nucleosidase [Lachnospirales bacterium]